ncbi:MAG: pitrilysin family protein [Pseudomonadota bacterium]
MIRIVLAAVLAFVASLPARAEVDIQVVTSPGGITAWLVEERSIPFVSLEIRSRGGTSLDAPDKRGATYLMMGLLEEGAGDYDARAFTEARESLAAGFGFDAYADAVSISARFLSENKDASLELLRLMLHEPRFDQEALDRVQGQVLATVRSELQDPDTIAIRRFYNEAFGTHPYAFPRTGTEETVSALTREDMVAALQGAFAKDRIVVSAVGDIGPGELAEVLDMLFSDLPDTGAPLAGPAPYLLDGGTTVVEFDTPQSVAVFGHEGFDRDDPDFFAAVVLNEILGGSGFDSRLYTEVREKRGLTYGVSTYLAPREFGALFLGQVASANDRVAEAINVIKDQWSAMAMEGVTEEELEATKLYLTGAYPLRFDGNSRIAKILAGMQLSNLEPDYVNTRNDKVTAVTLEDVKRVAARLFQPEELHFVVVGEPAGLDPSN